MPKPKRTNGVCGHGFPHRWSYIHLDLYSYRSHNLHSHVSLRLWVLLCIPVSGVVVRCVGNRLPFSLALHSDSGFLFHQNNLIMIDVNRKSTEKQL